jgi:hypothetical protein
MSATPPVGKTWHVRIDIGEHDGLTHAVARLESGSGTDLRGRGEAQLNPNDPDVPEIGDELAAARALSQLAHTLLDAAAGDLSQLLHERVRLDR